MKLLVAGGAGYFNIFLRGDRISPHGNQHSLCIPIRHCGALTLLEIEAPQALRFQRHKNAMPVAFGRIAFHAHHCDRIPEIQKEIWASIFPMPQ